MPGESSPTRSNRRGTKANNKPTDLLIAVNTGEETIDAQTLAKDLKRFTKENVVVPDEKLVKYVLNPEHERGKHKALIFEQALGFNQSNAPELKQAILEHIEAAEKTFRGTTEYGRNYNALLDIAGPNGKTKTVKTGWIIKPDDVHPRLVTTYVAEKKQQRG
jgi:hypothetical protein